MIVHSLAGLDLNGRAIAMLPTLRHHLGIRRNLGKGLYRGRKHNHCATDLKWRLLKLRQQRRRAKWRMFDIGPG